jgi:hypothetical protein
MIRITMTPSTKAALVLLLAAAAATACSDRGVASEASGDPSAPFFGPAKKAAPRVEQATPVPAELPPVAPIAAIPVPAFPAAATLTDDAARRRDAWTSSRFRCRAISTTRLRTCRMEPAENGFSITFPIADLTCDEVVFDAVGDPAELRSCRSTWIRVPKTIALARSRGGDVWSGSHSGWRWPNDGEAYCCPGVWLEAPASLR